MSDALYYEVAEANAFERLVVDVPELYRRFPLGSRSSQRRAGVAERIYPTRTIPLGYRTRAAGLLRRTNVDLAWFHEFAHYWTTVLDGRPLWGVHDFHFLRGWYRVQHQSNVVPDTDDAEVHLQAWQRPELLYQLFHQVYLEAHRPDPALLGLIRSLVRFSRATTLLEFGCATAPVTDSVLGFLRPRSARLLIADIQTISFHYGAHKLAGRAEPLLLRPENDFQLDVDAQLDAVFCQTVFEHLNRPFDTVVTFHERLAQGGLLFFDYPKTNGEGLDTVHGARERDRVLDFVEERFELVHGRINHGAPMGLTVARKR